MTPVVCLGAGALDYPEGKGGGHTWVSDEKLYLCARVEEA